MRKGLLFATGLIGLSTACKQDYNISDGRPDVDPGEVTECPFTPISGTKLSVYDCNPVFGGEDGEVGSVGFYATDVLGHPFYQMWYTAANTAGDEVGIGYAVSGDGTNWDMHPENPTIPLENGTWDEDGMAGQVVVWDEEEAEYRMMYQGQDFADNAGQQTSFNIGVATSKDGIEWDKHPANPVIDFEEVSFTSFVQPCWPLTMYRSNGRYKGMIAASDPFGSIFGGQAACAPYEISSSNGVNWSIGTYPLLDMADRYHAAGIASSAVVEYDDTLYMFYVGFERWENDPNFEGVIIATTKTLNLAMSTNGGDSWRAHPDNPLPVNLTSTKEISAVGAQRIGSRIHLWVSDQYDELGVNAVGYYLFEPDIDDHE